MPVIYINWDLGFSPDRLRAITTSDLINESTHAIFVDSNPPPDSVAVQKLWFGGMTNIPAQAISSLVTASEHCFYI